MEKCVVPLIYLFRMYILNTSKAHGCIVLIAQTKPLLQDKRFAMQGQSTSSAKKTELRH